MDDDELIASLAGGDDTALRELFARQAPWLAARLRKALSSHDVEDVLQETFLAVWRSAKTYQARGTPEAWLWVIARNQAALLLRRRGPAGQALLGPALLDQGRPVDDPAESATARADLAGVVLGQPGRCEHRELAGRAPAGLPHLVPLRAGAADRPGSAHRGAAGPGDRADGRDGRGHPAVPSV